MPVLALTTTSIFLEKPGREEVRGFFDQSPATMAAASEFDDFVQGSARIYIHPSTPPFPVDYHHPRFYNPEQHAGIGCTVSLWRSLEGVCAFAYSGLHAKALARRKEWFARGDWPAYAAWWVGERHRPTFADAVARIDHLHAHGPTPFAFNFKSPFGADGEVVSVDRDKVRQSTGER